MRGLDYRLDDLPAAKAFVSSLPRSVREARFPIDRETREPAHWKPDHTILALCDDEPVALADCIVNSDRSVAHGALIAKPQHGGYAMRALLKMKSSFPAEHWECTIRTPTKPTLGIARRFFDFTYDQTAWDIWQALAKFQGGPPAIALTPLLMSHAGLKRLGLTSVLDDNSAAQVFFCATRPGMAALTAPNGAVLDPRQLMSLAFDLLRLPMQARQEITRMLLLGAASLAGLPVDRAVVARLANPGSFGAFGKQLQSVAPSAPPRGGCFTVAD